MPTHDTQNRARTAPEDSADSAGPASPEQHILQYRAEAAPHPRGIAEKFLAEIARHFAVHFVEFPMSPRLNDNLPDDFRTEIGENHGGIDFLTGKFFAFPVDMRNAMSIFQLSKCRLDTPSRMVKLLYLTCSDRGRQRSRQRLIFPGAEL